MGDVAEFRLVRISEAFLEAMAAIGLRGSTNPADVAFVAKAEAFLARFGLSGLPAPTPAQLNSLQEIVDLKNKYRTVRQTMLSNKTAALEGREVQDHAHRMDESAKQAQFGPSGKGVPRESELPFARAEAEPRV
jgi:hypothetical protein